MAAESCIGNARYTYIHDDHNEGPVEAIDAHHVVVLGKRNAMISLVFLLLTTTAAFSLSMLKSLSSLCLAFGVQLETQYRSGRTVHRFIPIDKILKPVVNECVTPVTCYWSLSLIVRGEEELVLVFKELYPPVKMLIPIWKALCAATKQPRDS